MMKRVLSVIACLAMVITAIPAVTLVSVAPVEAAAVNLVTLPAHDGLTNNTSYTLGAGTDAEVTVYCDFRASTQEPTASITPKYVTIHNTGTYVSTANAKNTHNNTNKISTGMAWHYTVDDVAVYQGLQDTRKGWHIGSVEKNPNPTNTNSNSIGIEMCVHNFPATETFDGEQWSDGDGIMAWYENQFNQTMKNTAYLALVLCKRWGLDWETDIVTHYDALNYYPGGKDCPMQMRATYDPATNTFTEAGSYVDGRDGYFWQKFWGYLEAYAAGMDNAEDPSLTTASKIGTYQVNATAGLNVRAEADANATKVGALEYQTIAEVTALDGTWGQVTLDDGTVGWCNIVTYGDYIGIDAQAYEVAAASEGVGFKYDTDGGLILNNTESVQGQFDLFLPQALGTVTTPYMNLQVTPISGDGYYFGITQKGSAYWMMRDCSSGDELVVADTAPYMTNQETLSICVKDWWKPEAGYRIDHVRFYLAPGASIKINYIYFAPVANVVVDSRYNLRSASTNVNLMKPDTLGIVDSTKSGSYVYNNGMLTVVSDTADGYEVMFDVNETFDVNVLKRLLIAIESNVPFDLTLSVTHAQGEGTMSLTSDYYPGMNVTPVDGFIPAWTGTSGLDLYNYYNYNGIIPADGMSTVTMVTVKLGGAGTLYLNSLQLAENDRILNFRDGVYKEGSSPTIVEGILGDMDGDTAVSTADARIVLQYTIGSLTLTENQLLLADFNSDGDITTADARDILISTL